jgi:protein SCO1/2
MRRRWYAVSVAAAAVVGVTIGVAFHSHLTGGSAAADAVAVPALHGQATWAAGRRAAPSLALRDQHGRHVTLASLRGRTLAMTFMDSLCKQACPVEGQMIASAIRQVPAAARPQLIVVSVDPADTERSIEHAVHKWKLPANTLWLMGTRAQLKPVWDAYQITVLPISGDIVHSTAVYLVDKRGYERAGFLLPFVPGLVADDLRVLGDET